MSQYLSSLMLREIRRRKDTTNNEDTGKPMSKAEGIEDELSMKEFQKLGKYIMSLEEKAPEGFDDWSDEKQKKWLFKKLTKKYPQFDEEDWDELFEKFMDEEEDDE